MASAASAASAAASVPGDFVEETIRQTPTPLPPLPESDPLTAEQWGIFSAIADTVIPSFTSSQGNRLLQHPLSSDVYDAAARRIKQLDVEHGIVDRYLAENASAQPAFKQSIVRLLGFHLPEKARNDLLTVLNLLNTRAGALLLTGYSTPIDCLPIQTRERILQGWATARLPPIRAIFKSLTSLSKMYWIRTSPTFGQVLGYPRTPVHGVPAETSFPFSFLQIPPASTHEPEVIAADVVIVGSGCGGAVAAKALSEAGLKVLVVDKSYYWPPQHLPMSENDAAQHLFDNGGSRASDDASISIINGSAWGGGGTINWSASLQTQGYVRREWSEKFGLKHFTSSQYQRDLDAVCERMGVGTSAIEHNKGNAVLLEGARKLGWSAKVVPQNTGGEAHNCGYCTLGCGSCGKKGPTETFLPDAANAGASFIEGFECLEVLLDDSSAGSQRVTKGVRGFWTSRDSLGGVAGSDRNRREVIIHAPRVILSTGPLHSPILLENSGIRNQHLGKHLHLHPVSLLSAVWPEPVRPWEGPILTSVVNEIEDLDGDGYGAKLEAMTMLPGWFLPFFPWRSGLEWKAFAAKMKHMTGYISLARDRYGGRVYADPADRHKCRIAYTPSKHDQRHVLAGLARLAEIVYVEGALEIHVGVPGVEPFIRPSALPSHGDDENVRVHALASPSISDAGFAAWRARLLGSKFRAPDSLFGSAHQMGTCRMGVSEREGVVDERGRVFGARGLYVCDSSVFPSASGVNPMVTTMGIARGIGRGIVEELGVGTGQVRARL